MKIFQYAFCYDFDKKIQFLAELCPEKWSFGSNSDHVILKNYIEHTLSKVSEEGKVIETEEHSLFNTGLYTQFYEEIYAYFTPNQNPGRQRWFLEGFYTSYQLSNLGIVERPKRADYFKILLKWFLIRTVILYRSMSIFLTIPKIS